LREGIRIIVNRRRVMVGVLGALRAVSRLARAAMAMAMVTTRMTGSGGVVVTGMGKSIGELGDNGAERGEFAAELLDTNFDLILVGGGNAVFR
jgi:D-arabinose 5-phosphate isomerase GutQ